MKFVLLTLCLFALTVCKVQGLSKDDMPSLKSFEECLDENGISSEDLDSLEESDDPKLKCIMACVFEKQGVLKNGKIDKNLMKKSTREEIPELNEKQVSDLIDKCVDIAKDVSDICEKTNIITYCMKEEFDKLNIKFDK